MDIIKRIAGNPYLNKKENTVRIDAILLEDILKLSNTPFMVLLENRIRQNINTFRSVFESVFNKFTGFYSFKSNFLPEVCKIVLSEGFGAELIGLPELNLALKLGFPSNKIIIGGPYLPENLITKSVQCSVREIIVYNLKDIERINSIAQKHRKIQNICIRINSQKYSSKLGVEINNSSIKRIKSLIKECNNVEISTILSHFSTQMNNPEQFIGNTKVIMESIKRLSDEGILIENINLGGGFPEAVTMKEDQLIKIALEIKSIMSSYNIHFNNIYFEPGRYVVGDAGIFISKVVNYTDNRWMFLDIGNNICPKFARNSLRFYNISKINKPHKYQTSIAGIVPTDQDVLAKNYYFTENIDVGDIIMVNNVGAYSLTFSNRFPYELPPIYLIRGATITKIFDPARDHDFSIGA